MAANYPAALPVKTVAGATLAANPHSSLHNKMYEEVVAIATELGTNVSGASATLAARLDLIAMGKATWNSGTVNQSTSNISKTINRSVYFQHGSTIHWHFNYSMTGSGSAGTAITLSLPVTAIDTRAILGPALYQTGSASYVCMMKGDSTTSVKLFCEGYTDAGLGASPSFAVASGHVIQGYIVYGIA
jgi:hypothetical protein